VIYPTGRSVVLAAIGAPLALIAGLVAPAFWVLAAGWLALLAGLILIDAATGPSRSSASLATTVPPLLGVGGTGWLEISVAFEGRSPCTARVAVQTSAGLTVDPAEADLRFSGGEAGARLSLVPLRRGSAEISSLWLRWRGDLGLVWKQLRQSEPAPVTVAPDIHGVKAEAIRLYARDALFGLKTQLETGAGSEFHALREVDGAVDPRTIDWKQSARHGKLLGKEFRVERNHPVVFAIDTGRAMCEPLGGATRLDRAINAALLLSYVCMKTGDPVGAYGFGARPGGFSGLITGAAGFGRLRRRLADLEYGEDETNYTLGLTQLGATLKRRTLIVVFTEFADTTSAELMMENIGRLLRRHVVLFVAPRDEVLDSLMRAEPIDAAAVSRAVTAHALVRARNLVIARLTRLGARVIDVPADRVGAALISAYLDLKRSDAA
jgi:uncharacterized protein (DUF58 family)